MPKQMERLSPVQPLPESIHADRLIIATNRGPVEYYMSRDHQLKYRRGAGGVVTALPALSGHTALHSHSLARSPLLAILLAKRPDTSDPQQPA